MEFYKHLLPYEFTQIKRSCTFVDISTIIKLVQSYS